MQEWGGFGVGEAGGLRSLRYIDWLKGSGKVSKIEAKCPSSLWRRMGRKGGGIYASSE